MSGAGSVLQSMNRLDRMTVMGSKSLNPGLRGYGLNMEKQAGKADVSKIRQVLRKGYEGARDLSPVSVVDSMKMYSDFLEKQRKKTDETAIAKKKVRYSFKSISSKIISSRTSIAAKSAASAAKREIQRLKDARRTGKYDSEEIDAAIDHAKAMERIARKKARHLEEEEAADRCSSGCRQTEAAPAGENEENSSVKEEIRSLRDEADAMEKKAENGEYIESDMATNELIDCLCESMDEMLDQLEELTDLMDGLLSDPADMDPEDIEALKIRHRNREMKDMTKADAEYLKATFEQLEAERSGTAVDVAL